MYRWIGFSGLSASRNNSCATIEADAVSSTSPLRQIIRSCINRIRKDRDDEELPAQPTFSNLEKISSAPVSFNASKIQVQPTYMCASHLPKKSAS